MAQRITTFVVCTALLAPVGAWRSSAPRLARPSSHTSRVVASSDDRPHVAVVGGGWGGWGAAKALCEQGCRVTLIDALPDPTGATPTLSPSGKPIEYGVRGFWKDYPNINALADELGLRSEDVFTKFTNSSFYSPDGLEATAPVFSEGAFATLPSPLGQVLATFSLFERLPLPDRASMVGLLYAMLDLNRNEATFAAYDRMSAHDLFIQMRLSKRLVDDFIRPTLLVGLFKPPEELSAAVVMELLYYYALAHQDSFDVRWIAQKSIPQLLIAPLAQRLIAEHGLTVMGGCFVSGLELAGGAAPAAPVEAAATAVAAGSGRRGSEALAAARASVAKSRGVGHSSAGAATPVRASALRYKRAGADGGAPTEGRLDDVSGVVLALGVKGMRALVSGSPELARECPELAAAASLSGIDVISVRLWLDKTVPTRTPANVLAKFAGLRGAGGTFFMLDQLQAGSAEIVRENWGGEEPRGSIVACDLYNAGALLPLSDADIVQLFIGELLPAAVAEFGGAAVLDSWVGRSAGAVSWFSPGSYAKRPPLQTRIPNLVCAGDWVRMGAREHGAKGLCQERAFVSGVQAANSLGLGAEVAVLEVRPDEPQVELGRALNKGAMDALAPFGLASPWVR